MKYISTRGEVKPIDFQDTVLMGLADDGGLLIPEVIPSIKDKLFYYGKLSYVELALEIMKLFISDIPSDDLVKIINKSYTNNFCPEVAPLKRLSGGYILELFTGPTFSFKDIALQFIGNLFEYILIKRNGFLNILGATSGDTGSAGIYGVKGKNNINIFIMHPYKRISKLQELQMTTVLDNNVYNIAIKGSFDDCQRIMKEIATDIDFKRRYRIGAINSVNWARILAQIVYYVYASLKILIETKKDSLQIAVPTGNFGNILAAWYAAKMGIPISKIILATNENDILSRFFNTGVYSVGKVVETLSPAMDIQVASNFERYLYYKLNQDSKLLKEKMEEFKRKGKIILNKEKQIDELFVSEKATKEEVLSTIKEYYEKENYLLDPHTAVGIAVANKVKSKDLPLLNIATAHPAKFPEAIFMALGKDIARHPELERLKGLPARCQIIENDVKKVKNFIETSLLTKLET